MTWRTVRRLQYVNGTIPVATVLHEADTTTLNHDDARSWKRARKRMVELNRARRRKQRRKLVAVMFEGRPRWVESPTDVVAVADGG